MRCDCGLEISIPPGDERDAINCIRCGRTLPIPAAGTPPLLNDRAPASGPSATMLEYTQTTDGWESFRCQCGRTLQLSPAFAAPHIHCQACGATIQVH